MRTSRASAIVAGAGAAAAVALALGAQLPAASVSSPPTPPPASAVGPSPERARSGGAGTGVAPSATAVPAVAVTHGSRQVAKVALTFDADLSNYTLNRIYNGTMPAQYNEAVVNYLERTGTPATVFVTGMWAQQYPGAMRRFAANPNFEVANHTFSHEAWTANCYKLPYFTDDATKQAQVRQTNEVIASYTGKQPRFFRFPGLCHTDADLALVASIGQVPVDTDIQGSDAFAQNPNAVAQSIAAQVQPGSVILLHLNGAPNAPVTAQVVEQLVPMLAQRGLQPVTLSNLLAGGPS